MHAFDVLGDPVRRRILELLADGEQTSGAIAAVIQAEFGISQPGVSQHLRVLRESGFTTVRADAQGDLWWANEVDSWHHTGFGTLSPVQPPPRPVLVQDRGHRAVADHGPAGQLGWRGYARDDLRISSGQTGHR